MRIGIRTNAPRALDDLYPHLPPGWRPSRAALVDQLFSLRVGGARRGNLRAYNLLYWGSARRARELDLGAVLEVLESDLRLCVASAARRRIFVHAGVVGWKGRAILLPGRTFSGKSTLVAELLRAGATYYSDELAVLDGRGRVHPFAKPLVLRKAGAFAGRFPAEELGSSAGVRPLPVGLVALTRYARGRRWRPARLTPGRGLLALLSHTVPVRLRTQAALAALREVTMRAPVLKGVRGEARETAGALLRQVEAAGITEPAPVGDPARPPVG
ncbi:MAG TPA: hypothetical protein VLI67_07060 [Vicinamibacteria bacterium]|nr:hypothetical protein [Vicinamibacteria bacterium]